jgi:hypothetical protein
MTPHISLRYPVPVPGYAKLWGREGADATPSEAGVGECIQSYNIWERADRQVGRFTVTDAKSWSACKCSASKLAHGQILVATAGGIALGSCTLQGGPVGPVHLRTPASLEAGPLLIGCSVHVPSERPSCSVGHAPIRTPDDTARSTLQSVPV